MKNLKIKLGLFSLLAILAASVFLTSCEQSETILPNSNENLVQSELADVKYVLPKGVEGSEESVSAYWKSIDEQASLKLAENFRIAAFLTNENVFDAVWEDMAHGEHLSDIDMSNYLDENQLTDLASYVPDSNIESRACGTDCYTTQYNGSWCTYHCYKWCIHGTYFYYYDYFSYVSPC